jgi:hypothetical protein
LCVTNKRVSGARRRSSGVFAGGGARLRPAPRFAARCRVPTHRATPRSGAARGEGPFGSAPDRRSASAASSSAAIGSAEQFLHAVTRNAQVQPHPSWTCRRS